MSKKVLVTGCSGQDGSYMVDYLLANTDYEIYGMVRRTSKPDYSNLKDSIKNKRLKLVVGDLSDSQSIDNIVREIKPDYFINLAAQSFVASSWKIPEQTFDIDAIGVIRCLEVIRKHVPHCRFYNAGSSEEFGDVRYSPQDMKHPLRARSPYGAAKIAARHIVKVYRESYNLYAIQGLLFNHESERRGEEFVTRKITLGVARIFDSMRDGNFEFDPIELGNLDAMRDWSHAEDFVRGIWMMLNQEEYRDDLKRKLNKQQPELGMLGDLKREWLNIDLVPHLNEYMLCSGETHSIREFIEKAFKIAGIKGVWNKGFFRKAEEEKFVLSTLEGEITLVKVNPEFYRPAEVELLLGDAAEVKNGLGWKPEISFDKLVERMVRNDVNNLATRS